MKLQVTEKAKRIFKESTEDPYLRVGARPGGCSGWTFVLESDTDVDSSDSIYDDFAIIDTKLHILNQKNLHQYRIPVRMSNLNNRLDGHPPSNMGLLYSP
jgi:Fe-S cluster assembly iron-binding protein IscA